MITRGIYERYPIVEEIVALYSSMREDGLSRDRSISMVLSSVQDELDDEDDAPFVWIGIAVALCQKNELTEEIMIKARQSVQLVESRNPECDNEALPFDRFKSILSDKSIGPEAQYKKRKTYNPDWKIGDTFIHPILQDSAKKAGIYGSIAVIRKVGDYIDLEGQNVQLVYVTICSGDAIPKSGSELSSLGYLRVMKHDRKWDYLCQITFTSKKDEESWKLKKIGCFHDGGSPRDATDENPLVSMPLLGKMGKTGKLGFEDQICLFYKRYGIFRDTDEQQKTQDG